jgi:hypothetical protein
MAPAPAGVCLQWSETATEKVAATQLEPFADECSRKRARQAALPLQAHPVYVREGTGNGARRFGKSE